LGRWKDFRTFAWVLNIEYPEAPIEKTQKLLKMVSSPQSPISTLDYFKEDDPNKYKIQKNSVS